MIKDINNSFGKTEEQINKMARDIRAVLETTANDVANMIGIMAQSNMLNVDASGVLGGYAQEYRMGASADSTRLTVRSGRLARSLAPFGQQGAFNAAGQREGIHEIDISSDRIKITKGTKVPYRIHQYGGQIEQNVTEKQKAFFWAMAMQTGDEKFKAMALSGTLSIKIPKRPFMPEESEVKVKAEEMFKQRLMEFANAQL